MLKETTKKQEHKHTHWPKEIYATPSELQASGSIPNGLLLSRHIAPMITSGMLPIFPVQLIREENGSYTLSLSLWAISVTYAIAIDDIKQFIEKRLCVHLVLLIQSQILRNKNCASEYSLSTLKDLKIWEWIMLCSVRRTLNSIVTLSMLPEAVGYFSSGVVSCAWFLLEVRR